MSESFSLGRVLGLVAMCHGCAAIARAASTSCEAGQPMSLEISETHLGTSYCLTDTMERSTCARIECMLQLPLVNGNQGIRSAIPASASRIHRILKVLTAILCRRIS